MICRFVKIEYKYIVSAAKQAYCMKQMVYIPNEQPKVGASL